MDSESKKVFISYSWAVQESVVDLANRLIANGVDVVIDVYDLKDGQDKYSFMEKSVNDPAIDRVLIICDKTYTEKANNRSGGVGDEIAIISPEIYGNVEQEKFVPIIFERDEKGHQYCPAFIKSRIYIDLSPDNYKYEEEYERLLRNIYDKPLFKKPAIGKKPEWLENETVDFSSIRDIIKQIRGYNGTNQAKLDYLLKKSYDEFVEAAKQYAVSNIDELLPTIEKTKPYRDLFMDFCEALIICNVPIGDVLSDMFEILFNELHETIGYISYADFRLEIYDFIIQELFICTTAFLLSLKKYNDLHLLLNHTYFLCSSYGGKEKKATTYFSFYKYLDNIERLKEKEEKRLLSLTADIIIKRERKPILTSEAISNADILLYQVGTLFGFRNDDTYSMWFPITYIYHNYPQLIWQKLKSRNHCLKIAPLFGVDNIDELKSIISKSKIEKDMTYPHSIYCAPCILSSIKLDEIGVLP